ncbi:nucleoside-diphosphate kinase [Alphaproteobacteria bacterium]|nr:nucleoside-diphosphate kinase [Alphaproteobacteria bacterium]
MAQNTIKDYDAQLDPLIYGLKHQRTFVMIKPDGVMRGLVGEIIHRFEKAGLRIVALKMLIPTEELARKHYPSSDERWVARLGDKGLSTLDTLGLDAIKTFGTDDRAELGGMVVEGLVKYFQSGPVVPMIIEGVQAINMVRKLVGDTLPFKADAGTIRGDFSVDSPAIANVEKRAIHNIIHASETADEAANEIKLWFGDDAGSEYSLAADEVMYNKHY